MTIADFNHEDFEQARAAEHDEKLLVKFFYQTIKDETASKEQGRAVFKDCEFIDIRIPGMRGSGATRRASYRDKQRFPRHYSAFQQRVELPEEGTPLSEWPLVSRSLAEELAFLGVKTVESLASIADSSAGDIMGGLTLKAKANKWLEKAKNDVSLEQMEAELAKRDTLIANMQAQLDELQAASKPKRKRRTKEEMARDNDQPDTSERLTGSSGSGGGAVSID